MSVFALLIKYLFIVFILVAFFVIGVVAYFLHRVRNAARRFANGGMNNGMGGNGGFAGMGGGRSSAANNGTYGSDLRRPHLRLLLQTILAVTVMQQEVADRYRAISTIRVRLARLIARYSQRTKANTLTLWKNKEYIRNTFI